MKNAQADVVKLLEQLDRYLAAPLSILLIDVPGYQLLGMPGAADEIGFASTHASTIARLRLSIPFNRCQISDLPFLFETRLQAWNQPGLQMLRVQVLDRSDALVHKILVNQRKDIQTVAAARSTSGLSYESLLESFCAIDPAGGDLSRKKNDFLFLIENLFGKTSATHAEAVMAERLGG